ncbi:MAG TPA: TylF/MycF/NovP-related O-methyltransferase [Gammaproteobacteria bacterium]|nr:TylF/MycF/NovP-related O-methyltransferase [Gammaproteobacteria bacterium]
MTKFASWNWRKPKKELRADEQNHPTPAVSEDRVPVPSRMESLITELEQLSPGTAEQLLSQLCAGLRPNTAEDQRYRAAELAATAIYPKFKFSEYGRLFLEDEQFLDYYRRFMDPDNWHSLDRKYTLNQLLKQIATLPGDLAECGAYKGASAYLMCRAAQGTNRRVHLFDSFEGLSEPGRVDGDYWVHGALSVPEDAIRQTIAEFDNYRIYRGWIPQRFGEVSEQDFCLVHIDVDLYQPTLDSLDFFYPRMVRGGIILMDDYGFVTCPGAKRAADEYFADKPEAILMFTTGQSVVIKQ